MAHRCKPLNHSEVTVLAVDLDGTFLPLDQAEPHCTAMKRLGAHFSGRGRRLVFVTGRHYESVRAVMKDCRTPRPDRVVCDVGTSIYRPATGETYDEVMDYRQHLDDLTRALPLSELKRYLQAVGGLREQEAEKQGPHKLSYYTDEATLDDRVASIEAVIAEHGAPFTVIGSVDPFNRDGLIDVLPRGVDKAYGLRWLATFEGFSPDAIIFAGDSGNDLAALTAGFRAVVVGNASDAVKAEARKRMQALQQDERLYVAQGDSTSGVLEGCQYFGVHIAQ